VTNGIMDNSVCILIVTLQPINKSIII